MINSDLLLGLVDCPNLGDGQRVIIDHKIIKGPGPSIDGEYFEL